MKSEMICANLIQTEIVNQAFTVAPILFYLNPSLKIDFDLEKVFEILTGEG